MPDTDQEKDRKGGGEAMQDLHCSHRLQGQRLARPRLYSRCQLCEGERSRQDQGCQCPQKASRYALAAGAVYRFLHLDLKEREEDKAEHVRDLSDRDDPIDQCAFGIRGQCQRSP